MDHGQNNLGDWNTSQYGAWNGHSFDSSASYTQSQLPNDGFHDPNTFAASSANLSQQQPRDESPQHPQYPDFSYYPNQSSTGWMEAVSPSTVSQSNGVVNHVPYTDYQPPHEVNQTVNPAHHHFSYLDLSQNNQFGNHVQASDPQDVQQHGYNTGNTGSSVVNRADSLSYRQEPTQQSQWQNNLEPIPNGYGSGVYERSVVASPPVDTRNKPSSPSPYPSAHPQTGHTVRTLQPAIPAIQQARFASAPDVQPLQRQISTTGPALLQAPGFPNGTVQQPVAQNPTAKQSEAQQPVAKLPGAVPGKTAVPGPRLDPTAEIRTVAKKNNNTSQPVPAVAPDLRREGSDPYLLVDAQLAAKALDQADSFWPGVVNLATSDEVQTCTVPERITRQPMFLRGDKPPLFSASKRPSTWTQAEILGIHMNNYLSIPRDPKHDLERVKTDAVLDVAMSRADKAVPKTWWTDHIPSEGKKRKLPEWKAGSAPSRRLDPPADTIGALSIKASAILALPGLDPQSLDKDHPYVKTIAEEYANLLTERVEELKESETFKELSKAFSERRKKGASPELEEKIRKLQSGLGLLQNQFACVIDRGLQEMHPAVLANLEETKGIKVSLFNSLVRLLNIKLGNSSLVTSLLKLLARFKTVKPSQLETYKFTSSEGKVCAQSQLEALKNPETTALVAIIIANAKKNEGSEPVKSEKGTSDAKRSNETGPKKAVNGLSKAGGAASGTKRQREDDGEARSSKKILTESSRTSTSSLVPGAGGKVSSDGVKASAAAAKSTVPPRSVAAASATPAPAKPRSGLLLPGKQRSTAKATTKPESPKPDTGKLVKLEAVPKVQPRPVKSQQPLQPASSSPDIAKASKLKTLPASADASRSSRTLADLLAEIDKPKAVVSKGSPTPAAVPEANETDQEKARRLRKEERRRLGLRVTFKADDRLVEVREFQREEGEERSTNVTRDVKSENKDKREGMALRKGHVGEIRPWDEPAPTDFGVIPEEKRERAFVTRGGDKDFQTEQQRVMAEREKTELIAIYTDPAEIPPTPKSPPAETSQAEGDVALVEETHLPDDQQSEELRLRQRDQVLWGFWRATLEAQSRLEERLKPDHDRLAKAISNRFSISLGADATRAEHLNQQILQLLLSRRAREFSEPVPYDENRPRTKRRRDHTDASIQQAVDYVEEVVEWSRQDKRRRIEEDRKQEEALIAQGLTVSTGIGADSSYHDPQAMQGVQSTATAQAQDFSAAWAEYFARQGQQAYAQQVQQSYAEPLLLPTYAQQQQPSDADAQVNALLASLSNAAARPAPQQPIPADNATAQIQALMAALSGSGNTSQQPAYQPAPAAPSEPQNAEYLLSLMQWATGQNQPASNSAGPPYSGGYESNSNYGQTRQQHQQQDDSSSSNGGEPSGRGGRGLSGSKSYQDNNNNSADIPEHLRGINRSLIGTKPCSFYAQGRCAKGDKCTFRHD